MVFFPGQFTHVHLSRSMPEHPESFPVNALVPIAGTPLEKNDVRTQRFI
jgi:biotin synthase-like enzyme